MYIMQEYDDNLKKIVLDGFNIEGDRTGVGTRCLFGLTTTVDISKRIPVLTKRKVAWKSIVKEVLWYISGSHSILDLEAQDCGIWTPWKNDKFSTDNNLPHGSGGYIYGYNLIHYGADINKPNDQGFNQLDYVINTLRSNPKSRQACFTFWRPDTNTKAVLPACHAFYSFIVSPDEHGELKTLNCHIFQRSNDYPIGVGMGNLLTGSLFTYMIAQQTGLVPGILYHTGSHCHIYNNSMMPTMEYLSRTESPDSPILRLNKRDSIYDYVVDDFSVEEYNPLPPIKFDVAV